MGNIPYQKAPTTIREQIELLKARGVLIENQNFAEKVLESVSYFRFSAYLYPFRIKQSEEDYRQGTSFDLCWRYYRFDRKLRFVIMDALERVEVATRTAVANSMSLKYGAFFYRTAENFATPTDYRRLERFNALLEEALKESKEDFVRHFKKKYDASNGLPIWMAAETMTFGNILTLFKLLKKRDKENISRTFGRDAATFESWLTCLNYVRNVCAHHARIWNRHMAVPIKTPHKSPEWNEPAYPVTTDRIYSVLCVLKYLLDIIVPQSGWTQRLLGLLNDFPEIPRISMGMPRDFEKSSLWSKNPITQGK